jgi:hypothetical protein
MATAATGGNLEVPTRLENTMSATATTAHRPEYGTTGTYRAAVVHGFQEPLTLEQVPIPS